MEGGKKLNSLQEADMLRYHSIYQYLQQRGHFSLTKAGERYTENEKGEGKGWQNREGIKIDGAKGTLLERMREGKKQKTDRK